MSRPVDPSSGHGDMYDPWAPTQQSPAPGGPQPVHPHMPPPGHPAYRRPPKSPGAATASLVLGILGLVGGWATAATLNALTLVGGIVCLLAVTLGHEGLRRARAGSQGRSNALAGTILGYVSVLVWLVVLGVNAGRLIAEG